MSRRIVAATRTAIRVDEQTLLAVPPMPLNTPREVRVKVFEYVLRRQPGLAEITVQLSTGGLLHGDPTVRLEALIGETPLTGSAA